MSREKNGPQKNKENANDGGRVSVISLRDQAFSTILTQQPGQDLSGGVSSGGKVKLNGSRQFSSTALSQT
jgi:hypothetical protein